ncbi:hypothetical protein QR685DRAFT_575449 [Neurospora intermedia]|uniref:Uncharacterized protein n=1 Tax=Neurospora intermedia TaxID=5142 RepID=A0ABR3D0S6_NEUIN
MQATKILINLMPVPQAKAWKYINGKPEASKAAEQARKNRRPPFSYFTAHVTLVAITPMFPNPDHRPTAEHLASQHEAVRQRTVLFTDFRASLLLPVLHIFHDSTSRYRTIIEREKQTEIPPDAFVNGNVEARADDALYHCVGSKLHVLLSWD